MPLPRAAIVGRPNVGKSSLLNMLAREKVSIVDPTPGVTRDRVSTVIELPDFATPPLVEELEAQPLIEVVDTGGLGLYTAEGETLDDAGQDLRVVAPLVEAQIARAIDEADLVLFVVDVQAGLTPLDEQMAQQLRQALQQGDGPAVLVVANKCDSESWEAHALDAAALGLGEPALVSARTGRGRRPFLEQLAQAMPESAWRRSLEEPEPDPALKIAILGRRNAGKSTFVNALAGQERVIVSELAGATRDAVDVRFEIDGRVCVAIDTAGFRRKRSTRSRIEWWARERALRSLERADVALLLIDAQQPVSHVEKRLGQAVVDAHKPCVIVVNKWDLAEEAQGGKRDLPEAFRRYFDKELRALRRAPIVFASAREGTGVREAIDVAFELRDQALARIPTHRLNELLRWAVQRAGSGAGVGRDARIYFASQVGTAPPTIALVVNDPAKFTAREERFLRNVLAEEGPFPEVPVRLLFRPRKRVDLETLKRRARERDEAHRQRSG